MGNRPTVTPAERSQRITDVCELAAQLRPEERDVFIEGECQGNDQLLQEVKTALPGYLLATNKEGAVAVVKQDPPPPPPVMRIGRYEITGTIGSGGSGRVYSALDRTVGRVVAIKVLNAPGDPDLVRRFQAEAKTVANLHHKNIVTVHEYGEENGVPYLVMEYLKGTTLQELIHRGFLSLLEKVEIMSEVADGLHYAHECGITHRDVKPANIMQLTDGAVKIMDFGIARLGAEGATRLTQTGLLIGSIMYMAPEQFSGTADAQTDVFGYGVTFYELLTGVNPFAAADPVGIIFKIANSDPAPVTEGAPDCPPALERIISRCLARDRETRYNTLWDVTADISGILAEMRRDQAYRFYQEADQLYTAGQLDAAKLAVRKVLRLDPGQEDARQLRAEIEEALRRRDAASRAESLIGQAETAVGAKQFEEAGALLESIRELGVSDTKLQGRWDWAVAQVEQARRRESALQQAQRDLRNLNFTVAFQAVSEVLAEDPGSTAGKDLLQEIRKQIAAGDAKRRFRERIAEIHGLIESRQFDVAVIRIDSAAADFPVPDSPENQELQALRAQASAEARRQQIALLVSQAEALMARQEFDQTVALLDAAIKEFGDDWDLTRLILQARVARIAAREQADEREQGRAQERQLLAQLEATENAPGTAEAEQWRQAIGRLDQTLGPNPASEITTEIPSAQPPELRGHAIQAEGSHRQLPTEILDQSRLDRVRPDGEPPARSRRTRTAIWILAGVAVAIFLAILWVARPQFSLLGARLHTPAAGKPVGPDSGGVPRGADPAASQPAVGAPAVNPPACKSSGFALDRYGDLLTGELSWTGALAAGSQLEIVNRRASTGSVEGEIFPRGVPIRIFVTPPRIRVVTAPAAENCWDPRLVLENLGAPQSAVRIQWEVLQP